MQRFLLISLAGALGTGARYLVGLACTRAFGPDFPVGTLVVNVVGCFLIALVMQVAARDMISETTRYVLATGFMGGLTTYSAFNYESTRFIEQRAWGLVVVNVGATLFVCVLAGFLGAGLGKRV
jgi:CrcB protein